VCRGNLRGVVRGRGGLYQQLRRAPSPFYNASPPRQENPEQEYQDTEDEYDIDDDDVFMFPPDPDADGDGQQEQNNVEHQSDGEEDGDPGHREPVAPVPAPDLLSREDLVQLGIVQDGE